MMEILIFHPKGVDTAHKQYGNDDLAQLSALAYRTINTVSMVGYGKEAKEQSQQIVRYIIGVILFGSVEKR